MKIGVAWLNLGGPATTAVLPDFLRSLLSDPLVIGAPAPVRWGVSRWAARFRSPRVARQYDEIGGGSPLLLETERQLDALGVELGPDFTATTVFRHSPPRSFHALEALARDGVEHVVAFPAYPQRSHGTTDSALVDLRAAARPLGIETVSCPSFPDDEDFISSLAEGIRSRLEGAPARTHVILSSHGLPESALRHGDPYRNEVTRTAEALGARFPELPMTLAFQSRLGPVPWTRPYLTDEIKRLGRAGLRCLVVAPIAFACENFETLFELDLDAARVAARVGISDFRRAPAPGTHPAFIRCAATLIRDAAGRAGWLNGRTPSPTTTTGHAPPPEFSTR